jgi:predicted MFS family arabinose efflux permease
MTHDLTWFAGLRVLQGILMAAAFTFTITHLSESLTPAEAANALAAYVAGNVASNLVGRIVAAAAAVHFGLSGAFVLFAILNVTGAILVRFWLLSLVPSALPAPVAAMSVPGMSTAWSDGRLRAAYAIGFLILFAFIGTFSYVNFVLVGPPIRLGQMNLGWIYLVFLPSLIATPFAGQFARHVGLREALYTGFGVALVGLALTSTNDLTPILLGLTLVGVGTFLAQATMTALVGRLAGDMRASASGLYLCSYYLGGLAGSVVLGFLFDVAGWTACVLATMLSMVLAAGLVSWTGAGRERRTRSALSLR